MPVIEDMCCACGTYSRIAAFAILRDGRHLALCPACHARPERLRAFVAQYHAACRDNHDAAEPPPPPRDGQPCPA